MNRRDLLRCCAGTPFALSWIDADLSVAGPTTRKPAAVHVAARAAAEWLMSRQQTDGLFEYGMVPCVNLPLNENNLLRQLGAAAAMAKAGEFFRDAKLANSADRAIETLLAKTTLLDAAAKTRGCKEPPTEVNPVGYAALLLIALCERIEARPDDRLAEMAEQLARFLRTRQREDGTLDIGSSLQPEGAAPAAGMDYYPGEALFAVARSNLLAKADWKLEFLDRARKPYREYFADSNSPAFIPWQTAAYAAAFCQRGQRPDADFAFELADRLTAMQYGPRRRADNPNWVGGFGGWEGNAFVAWPPGIVAACYAEALVCACRAARTMQDRSRGDRYAQSLRSAVDFLLQLQFTAVNTGHFADGFRPKILGAFHADLTDGTVRVDFNQHALFALMGFLELQGVPTESVAGDRSRKANECATK